MNALIPIRPASEKDRPALLALLTEAGLPTQDLPVSLEHFLVAEENSTLLGCVGLELLGDDVLLRSLAVTSSRQGTGLGKRLYEAVWNDAQSRRVRVIYLITTTAERFFEKYAFVRVERLATPPALQRTAQFRGLCPSSAAIMCQEIRGLPATEAP